MFRIGEGVAFTDYVPNRRGVQPKYVVSRSSLSALLAPKRTNQLNPTRMGAIVHTFQIRRFARFDRARSLAERLTRGAADRSNSGGAAARTSAGPPRSRVWRR